MNSVNFQVRFILAAIQRNLSLVLQKFVLLSHCFASKLLCMFEISLVMAAVQMQHTCLQQNVVRVAATCKYQLNFVNFQGRLVLAAMQKNVGFVSANCVLFSHCFAC